MRNYHHINGRSWWDGCCCFFYERSLQDQLGIWIWGNETIILLPILGVLMQHSFQEVHIWNFTKERSAQNHIFFVTLCVRHICFWLCPLSSEKNSRATTIIQHLSNLSSTYHHYFFWLSNMNEIRQINNKLGGILYWQAKLEWPVSQK